MPSHFLGPAYNTLNNINNSQLTVKKAERVPKESFEKSLEIENNRHHDKLQLSDNLKPKANNHLAQASQAEPSSNYSKNYVGHNQNHKIDGMNLAIKEKTDALAETVVGILLNFAMNTEATSFDSFAEGIYRQEAIAEQVNSIAGDLVEDLSAQFYEESLRNEKSHKDATEGTSSR